jgi:Family of unknown function (DUF5691)
MWRDIIKTTLIGTDKCTPSVPTLEKLQEMGIHSEDVSESVLQGAGFLTLLRKGGYPLMDFKGTLPEVSEVESAILCPNSSVLHLKAILEGDYEDALEEFLFYAKQCKRVLPAQFLPQLFHYSRGNRILWALVEPVIGSKGRWLLKQNDDWSHLIKIPLITEGAKFEQLSNEETLKQAREIITLLNTTRFIWSDDKKINAEIKRFAYKADITLIENLRHLFSAEIAQAMDDKVENVFKILFFRKDMVQNLGKN